eukprot:TRINITY_DN14295_c0_g1_i1.p1 TRINITY_DN14295_c0_g1~~TRINITY_DN14295_c0_g1_i1.p1  ORF type:complete len:564 (+),score=28.51 TRINITY_DN14295_c0_g1_i1:152-1843(+)
MYVSATSTCTKALPLAIEKPFAYFTHVNTAASKKWWRFAVVLIALCIAPSKALHEIVVRYSVLDPEPSRSYLRSIALPMLRSSLCLAEKYFAPVCEHAGFGKPIYVIYTDDATHVHVDQLIVILFPSIQGRFRLVNLDDDPEDKSRLGELAQLRLDPTNYASVRRTLADAVHLPSQAGRLLLGLDISFLACPSTLVENMLRASAKSALYMADLETFERPYLMTGYPGPQCPGFLADFVYLSPGLEVSAESIRSKALWYASQPIGPERTTPPTFWLAAPGSRGLHGIDQFALNLAVAAAVSPQGHPGCQALNGTLYMHRGGFSRMSYPTVRGRHVEAVHDKVTSSCGAGRFDTCHASSGCRFVGNQALKDMAMHERTLSLTQAMCQRGVLSEFGTHRLWGNPELTMLASTLCILEEYFAAFRSTARLPAYGIFTSDRTCGGASSLLSEPGFSSLAPRLRLYNLENDDETLRHSGPLSVGVDSCATGREAGQKMLSLEVSFASPASRVSEQLQEIRTFNWSGTLFMMDLVHTSAPPAGSMAEAWGWVGLGIFFCLCGREVNLPCP